MAETLLMVSTSYPADARDWRGLFIRDLTYSLARRDDVRLRLWSPPGEFPDRATYCATKEEADWLTQLMTAGGIAHRLRTGGMRGWFTPLQLLRMLRAIYRRENDVDVYHINWLQNALALPRNGIPLLVTVLGTDVRLLDFPGMVTLLRRVFRARGVMICPNARWMVPKLERLFGDLASIRFVPFGIARCWFEIERVPDNPPKWLCVSRLTRDKIGTLFDWCEPYFSGKQRELHLFGPMQEPMALPDWVCYHGPVTPEALSAKWFPRACGLISLSQHAEGRPQVMLEAMASGLPIIASRIPAHVDLLVHGQTGWLVDCLADLGSAFDTIEKFETNFTIGAGARAWAGSEIGSWDDCAARYAALYKELLESR